MHSVRTIAVALSAGFAILSVTACAAAFGDQYQEAVHTRVGESPTMLHVEDSVGDVTVLAWEKPYVQIDATKKGPSADAVHAMTISAQPSGSRLDVSANLGSDNNHRSVDFTIHLPASASVSVEANVGKIDIEGFARDVEATADVGKVSVVMARLGKGQHVDVKSSVGTIDLTIPHDADAAIEASTSVGSVKGNVPFAISRNVVGAQGSATIGSGAAAVHLTASTGSINVSRE